jgi:hypothetical protein
VVQLDNTGKNNKNVLMLQFLAIYVWLGVYKEVNVAVRVLYGVQ